MSLGPESRMARLALVKMAGAIEERVIGGERVVLPANAVMGAELLGTPISRKRRVWTEAERDIVRVMYPDTKTGKIAARLGRDLGSVYRMAAKLGLRKSAAYLASPDACRLRRNGQDHPGRSTQFPKGHIPANKGMRRPGWHAGRMKETQFKKGERHGLAALNYCELGTIRTDAEGYLRIKVRHPLPGEKISGFGNAGIWPLLNRHNWEQAKGPIPGGHNVVFKDGDRSNCAIENLELISRAEMMRRNSIHYRYPQEMVNTIMLLGALKRKLRERRAEEHDDGSAQPSL